MLLGRVWTALRGTVAWLGGYVVTLLLVLAGVAEGAGPLDGAARTFLAANAVPLGGADVPTWLVVVPVAVLALAGLQAGRATRRGIIGRLRGALAAVSPSGRSASRRAAVVGALLAAGYALTGTVVAVLVGSGAGGALVSGLLLGLVVAVPAAVLAANR